MLTTTKGERVRAGTAHCFLQVHNKFYTDIRSNKKICKITSTIRSTAKLSLKISLGMMVISMAHYSN